MAKRTIKTAPTADAPAPASTQVQIPVEPAASSPKGKLGHLLGLLLRPEGARLDEMCSTTGWQAHSVRGAMSGSLKKKLGLNISSEKTNAGRVYRIAKGAGA